MVDLYTCHGSQTLHIAKKLGWKIGARYTDLRQVKPFGNADFIDINWKSYSFEEHVIAVSIHRPILTVAQDLFSEKDLTRVLQHASILEKFSSQVIIVPKLNRRECSVIKDIPQRFLLGYSVPSSYGGTEVPIRHFQNHRVHLLGGRPDLQRSLGEEMEVVSLDCNRFTIDATFGKYFDGTRFKRHPEGGYFRCIEESISMISLLWANYPQTTIELSRVS